MKDRCQSSVFPFSWARGSQFWAGDVAFTGPGSDDFSFSFFAPLATTSSVRPMSELAVVSAQDPRLGRAAPQRALGGFHFADAWCMGVSFFFFWGGGTPKDGWFSSFLVKQKRTKRRGSLKKDTHMALQGCSNSILSLFGVAN